jgi:hypothetical protein
LTYRHSNLHLPRTLGCLLRLFLLPLPLPMLMLLLWWLLLPG